MKKQAWLLLLIGCQLNCTAQNKPLKYVNETNSFKMESKSFGQCNQFVPIGWNTQTNPEGTTFDMTSPDKSMYAGFAIFPINPYLHNLYQNNDLYSTNPELVILKLGSMIGQTLQGFEEKMSFDNIVNTNYGDYTLRTFQSGSYKGSVLYRIIPGDGLNVSKFIALRIAVASNNQWALFQDLLSRVAFSIRCEAKIVEHNYPIVKASISNRSRKIDRNKDDDYNYNAQLGTEEAHNPKTGENLTFSQSAWNETGPEGPGYYVPRGNEIIKLSPGRAKP